MMTRQSSQHCTSVHSTGVLPTSLTLYFDGRVWFPGLPAPLARLPPFGGSPHHPHSKLRSQVTTSARRWALLPQLAGRSTPLAFHNRAAQWRRQPPIPNPRMRVAFETRRGPCNTSTVFFLARMPRVYHSPHTTTPPAGSTPRTPRKPRPQSPYPAKHGRTRIARNTQISPLPISQPLQAHQGPVNRKQHTHQDKRSHRHIGHADLFYSPTSLRRFGVVMAPMAFSNWHKNRPTIKATTYLQNNN